MSSRRRKKKTRKELGKSNQESHGRRRAAAGTAPCDLPRFSAPRKYAIDIPLFCDPSRPVRFWCGCWLLRDWGWCLEVGRVLGVLGVVESGKWGVKSGCAVER